MDGGFGQTAGEEDIDVSYSTYYFEDNPRVHSTPSVAPAPTMPKPAVALARISLIALSSLGDLHLEVGCLASCCSNTEYCIITRVRYMKIRASSMSAKSIR